MNMHKILNIFLLTAATAGILWINSGCADTGTPPQDAQFVIPDSNISFYNDIQPMLLAKCGSESGCHSNSAVDVQRKLQYLELIDKTALMDHRLSQTGDRLVNIAIHKDNPQNAPLYLIVLEGYPNERDQMPPYWMNRSPLHETQIEGIKKWIGEGAKD